MSVEKLSLEVFDEMRAIIGENRISREAFLSAIARGLHAAIEEDREAAAKILDDEAEYYRSMVEKGGQESAAFHRTAAKVAAHLARKIRARSLLPPIVD